MVLPELGESFGRFGLERMEVLTFCFSTEVGGVHLMMLVMSFALLVV